MTRDLAKCKYPNWEGDLEVGEHRFDKAGFCISCGQTKAQCLIIANKEVTMNDWEKEFDEKFGEHWYGTDLPIRLKAFIQSQLDKAREETMEECRKMVKEGVDF